MRIYEVRVRLEVDDKVDMMSLLFEIPRRLKPAREYEAYRGDPTRVDILRIEEKIPIPAAVAAPEKESDGK